MAESKDEILSPDNSDDQIKFRDPLISGFDASDGEMESLSLDASAKSEPSVSRSSSLMANLSRYDDCMDDETRDLFVVVDDPEKHTSTLEAYVTFRITIKTTRCEFDDSQYQVRRRYNDFLWLRQRLEETYPTHLVPPLPEKHSLRRLDRFSPEFLKVRQQALQKFLTRLADHPVLSFDKNFQVFLTAKAWEFQAHKKHGTGILTRMSDSIHNISASYMMKNRSPEFTMVYEYVQNFAEKLSVIDRISQRIVKEQTDYVLELCEWGPIYTLWSNSEDQLTCPLLAMSRAVDICAQTLKETIESTEDNFSQPLKEYILYTDAIKAVLRRRDAIQMEYESTIDELNRRKDEREHVKISDQTYSIGAFLGKDPEDVKQQKQNRVDQQIEELTKKMEVLNDKTVCADTDLRVDMERWHKNKQKDLKEIFIEAADRQILYYEKCLKAWEDAIRAIQAKDISQEVPASQLTEISPNNTSSEDRGDTMEDSSTTSGPNEGGSGSISEPSV
ncbi:sorting nexin-30-like [Ostrea edulis]|uniref:sorting nexin-30-like n=1 Tax=Ostrea edulis TaxID=37623 RepID=UPI00209637D5|nr:sorting nexin-30-like [Ostrea edulis]